MMGPNAEEEFEIPLSTTYLGNMLLTGLCPSCVPKDYIHPLYPDDRFMHENVQAWSYTCPMCNTKLFATMVGICSMAMCDECVAYCSTQSMKSDVCSQLSPQLASLERAKSVAHNVHTASGPTPTQVDEWVKKIMEEPVDVDEPPEPSSFGSLGY